MRLSWLTSKQILLSFLESSVEICSLSYVPINAMSILYYMTGGSIFTWIAWLAMALSCASFFQVLCFASLEFRWTLVASIYLEADVKTINFEGMCFLGLVWPVLVLKWSMFHKSRCPTMNAYYIFFKLLCFFNKYDNSHFKNCKAGTMNWTWNNTMHLITNLFLSLQVFLGELIFCFIFLLIFKLLCFLISYDMKTTLFS
jgi:hypothetical protein